MHRQESSASVLCLQEQPSFVICPSALRNPSWLQSTNSSRWSRSLPQFLLCNARENFAIVLVCTGGMRLSFAPIRSTRPAVASLGLLFSSRHPEYGRRRPSAPSKSISKVNLSPLLGIQSPRLPIASSSAACLDLHTSHRYLERCQPADEHKRLHVPSLRSVSHLLSYFSRISRLDTVTY